MDEKEAEARPLMGTIFLVYIYMYIIGRAKRAPHWGVQSRFRVIYIYIYSILHILTTVFPGTRTVEYQPIFHGVT